MCKRKAILELCVPADVQCPGRLVSGEAEVPDAAEITAGNDQAPPGCENTKL